MGIGVPVTAVTCIALGSMGVSGRKSIDCMMETVDPLSTRLKIGRVRLVSTSTTGNEKESVTCKEGLPLPTMHTSFFDSDDERSGLEIDCDYGFSRRQILEIVTLTDSIEDSFLASEFVVRFDFLDRVNQNG